MDSDNHSFEWKSPSQLHREGAKGGTYAIKIQLEKLREDLMERFVGQGASTKEAEACIEARFVKKTKNGFLASPEAIALLDLKRQLSPSQTSWRTASHLVRRGEVKGSERTVIGKLKTLHDALIQDVRDQTNISEEEAIKVVEHNLIGPRRTGFGDDLGLYASPEALRILKDERILLSRDTNSHTTSNGSSRSK